MKIDFFISLCFGFFCKFDFSFRFFHSIQYFLIFKVWHDTTRGFWRPHLVLLVLCFSILFFHGLFDSWSLTITIFLVLFLLCQVVDIFLLFRIQWRHFSIVFLSCKEIDPAHGEARVINLVIQYIKRDQCLYYC